MMIFVQLLFSCALLKGFVTAGKDFYDNTVIDAKGQVVSLEKYRGQVTLVVNVASECGFTDNHYRGLVRAKNILSEVGKFEILAFPCNQFGAQEPKEINQIVKFAESTYDINFPIFGKINVIEKEVPEAWKYLIEKSRVTPTWNFFKYIVDADGQVVYGVGPWSDITEIFPKIREAVVAAADKAKEKTPKPPAPVEPPAPVDARPAPKMAPAGPQSNKLPGAPEIRPSTPKDKENARVNPPAVKPPAARPPVAKPPSHEDL